MTKQLSLYLYGSIIVAAGAFLLFSDAYSFTGIKSTLGIALTVAAVFAFMTAFSRQPRQVQFTYHELHALTLLVYGLSVIAFSDTMDRLIFFTAFLLLIYSFSEIIFCTWIFNLGQGVNWKILWIRLVLGLVTGIGTLVAMHYSTYTLEIFGSLFILVGINVLLYVPIMKKYQVTLH
jgi:uncharacterized membrane protein HdeD (DUF308 family)